MSVIPHTDMRVNDNAQNNRRITPQVLSFGRWLHRWHAETGDVSAGTKYYAKKQKKSERTIYRWLRDLREAGYNTHEVIPGVERAIIPAKPLPPQRRKMSVNCQGKRQGQMAGESSPVLKPYSENAETHINAPQQDTPPNPIAPALPCPAEQPVQVVVAEDKEKEASELLTSAEPIKPGFNINGRTDAVKEQTVEMSMLPSLSADTSIKAAVREHGDSKRIITAALTCDQREMEPAVVAQLRAIDAPAEVIADAAAHPREAEQAWSVAESMRERARSLIAVYRAARARGWRRDSENGVGAAGKSTGWRGEAWAEREAAHAARVVRSPSEKPGEKPAPIPVRSPEADPYAGLPPRERLRLMQAQSAGRVRV